LSEGIVRINVPKLNQEVDLKPGELAEYTEKSESLTTTNANLNTNMSWLDNRLVFDQERLSEIAKVIIDNYGLSVVFDEKLLEELVFSGSTPADDLSILFDSMEKLFGLAIERQNDVLIIKLLPGAVSGN
jgi:transmembrane sensor